MSYVEEIQKLTHDCGDCWVWEGADNGRGAPKYRRQLVRRVLFQHTKGEIPAGKYVSTCCGTHLCVNPEHLKIRTRAEVARETNARPSVKARKMANCAKANQPTMGKITMQIAEEIRARPEEGKLLAVEYNISPSLVSKVRRYMAWKPTANPFAGLL